MASRFSAKKTSVNEEVERFFSAENDTEFRLYIVCLCWRQGVLRRKFGFEQVGCIVLSRSVSDWRCRWTRCGLATYTSRVPAGRSWVTSCVDLRCRRQTQASAFLRRSRRYPTPSIEPSWAVSIYKPDLDDQLVSFSALTLLVWSSGL